MRAVKNLLKRVLPVSIQNKIIHRDEYLRIASINRALKYQSLFGLYNNLTSIVPDIADQYTCSEIKSEYFRTKVRALHAFQISLVQEALELLRLNITKPLTIVDIGDSCGTHLQYLKFFYKDIDTLSVNLDRKAVEKIQKKGLKAICAKAEDLNKYSVKAGIYLSFEMLEHLRDPINFLYKFSHNVESETFIVTVPYLNQSRVGLRYIKDNQKKLVCAENVHIFELSPDDWKLIFNYSGWSVVRERIYLQYPEKGMFKFLRNYWKKIDYEGFYGVILKRDFSWSDLYKDW